ncbi:hypothetical protein PAMA_021908 [Pampus argenteus]
MEEMLTCSRSPFSQVFGRQGQLMQATVQSLNSLNDQIANFMVTGPKPLEQEEHAFIPPEKETLQKSMTLMRHLLVDAQAKILKMMDDNKQLAQRIDGAIQSASQEVTNLRSELSATSRRLTELGATDSSASMRETLQHNHNGLAVVNRTYHPAYNCPSISMQAVQPAGACCVGEADWANLDVTVVAGGPPPSGTVMPTGTDRAVSEWHVGEGDGPCVVEESGRHLKPYVCQP